MKYWINKRGECGTMNNDGFVPESEETSKIVYEEYIKNIPVIEEPISDLNKLIKYAKEEKWI